ncbi:site-specific integrase [Mycolicibacterium sp. A43C]
MAARRQLPPQIKRVELESRSGGRPAVRYQLTVDTGLVDGKRKRFRKRYTTEREARAALDAIRGHVAQGTYVQPTTRTVSDACDDWIAGKRAANLKRSTLHGYEEKLSVVKAELGHIEVQKLTKRNVDDLVVALRAGGLKSPLDKTRKPWTPRSVNYMLGLLTAVLESEQKQGQLVRNVAALVDRIASDPAPPNTLDPAEVETVLAHIDGDRYAIAWQLALAGLRRGEIAGLRWSDVDLIERTLTVAETRLRVGKDLYEETPKSKAGGRTLPLPDHLVSTLKSTRKMQAADQLALGPDYQTSGYIVVNEAGEPLSPHALTSRWERMLKAAGVRHVRLHDARHTCGTLMHLLDNVPIAVISAWLGHSSKAFTMQTYVHSQPQALVAAAQSFARVVTTGHNSAT